MTLFCGRPPVNFKTPSTGKHKILHYWLCRPDLKMCQKPLTPARIVKCRFRLPVSAGFRRHAFISSGRQVTKIAHRFERRARYHSRKCLNSLIINFNFNFIFHNLTVQSAGWRNIYVTRISTCKIMVAQPDAVRNIWIDANQVKEVHAETFS